MRRSGETTLVVLLVIAVLGGGFLWLKPKFTGDKRRADASQEATAAVEATVNAQAASAAASVAKIGEANSVAPESPSRDFIAREVPAALAKLPAPDPAALLEAEKRRAAVMEGRLEEASKLYERESKRAAQLQKERDEALAERRAVDLRLSEVAAARAAAEQQRLIFILVAAAVGGLALFAYFGRVGPSSLGAVAAAIRMGHDPIQALDTHTAPWLQKAIRKHSKLATEPKD